MLDLERALTDCYIYSQRLLYGCQYKHQFPAEGYVVLFLFFPFFCVLVLTANYPNRVNSLRLAFHAKNRAQNVYNYGLKKLSLGGVK